MIIETTATGTIVISETVNGYLQTQKYIGYSREEAIEIFGKWVDSKTEAATNKQIDNGNKDTGR